MGALLFIGGGGGCCVLLFPNKVGWVEQLFANKEFALLLLAALLSVENKDVGALLSLILSALEFI